MGTIGRNPETGNLELRDDDGNLIEPNPEHLADLQWDEYCKEFGFDEPPRTPEELQAQMQTIRENQLRAEAETAEMFPRIWAEHKARRQADEDRRRRYEEAMIKLAEQANGLAPENPPQQSQGAGDADEPETDLLELTTTDVAILRLLAETPGVAATQYRLEDIASRKTIGQRLAFLRKAGYVKHPDGKKTGTVITDAGLKRLKTLPESST